MANAMGVAGQTDNVGKTAHRHQPVVTSQTIGRTNEIGGRSGAMGLWLQSLGPWIGDYLIPCPSRIAAVALLLHCTTTRSITANRSTVSRNL